MQIEELHIASLVVHAAPARLGEVGAGARAACDGARVHASSPAGKLVVTLEQPSAAAMTDAVLAHPAAFDGVLSAALVYQCADTLQAMNEEIPDASGVTSCGSRPRPPPRRSRRHGACRRRRSRPRTSDPGVKWSKAPCRFCGTGCGVNVAVKDNRVIATQGDPQAEVNRGLNCIKGYYLSKIMYGEDRLTTPLLRMKDGKYAQGRRVPARLLGHGLRRDGRAVQARR